jgi:glycosyltransferase involved in cell wall biosynthesis
MKLYTFSPTFSRNNFRADSGFFWRDSGLLHKAAVKLGHDSMVVLEGPAYPDDPDCIIRAMKPQLCDPEWWGNLGCDAVIMVAWALPKHAEITEAIQKSGIKFALHLDSCGNYYPYANHIEMLRLVWNAEKGAHPALLSRLLFFPLRFIKWTLRHFLEWSFDKYRNLISSPAISVTTPKALTGLRNFYARFSSDDCGDRFFLTGLPISEDCIYDESIPKENRIVSIGRWDAMIQKRPLFLIGASEVILRNNPDYEIDVFGKFPDFLLKHVDKMDPAVRNRFHVHGIQPGSVISSALQRSKIYLCTSSFESGPQTAYEAAACGATFISYDNIGIAAGQYLRETNHADLAAKDTYESFACAMACAISKWKAGIYDPKDISRYWTERCHSVNVVRKIMGHLSRK